MKKTLRNILRTGLIVGSLAVGSGCTGMGAAMQTSDDPRTRLIGTIMYHEGAHNERMEEAREGKTDVNVYGGERQRAIEEARKNIWTYEIINLDTDRTEIEVVSEEHYRNYIFNNFKNGKFPEKGYVIIGKNKGVCFGVWEIIGVESEKNSFRLIGPNKVNPKIMGYVK